MVNIKRFIDRVNVMETKSGKDLVIPSIEARALRDEIAKLLADKLDQTSMENTKPQSDAINISGGKFK